MAGAILGAAGGAMGGEILGMFGDMAGQLHQAHQQTKEARKGRKFAAWMAQNQYQMAVKDLRLAGLNPLLAVPGGGPGVPTPPMAQLPNVMEGFGASARGMTKNIQEVIARGKQMKLLDMELEKGGREVARMAIDSERMFREGRLFHQLEEKAFRETELLQANTKGVNLENVYKELGIPRARADEELYNTWYGEWSRKMGAVIRGVLGREGASAR